MNWFEEAEAKGFILENKSSDSNRYSRYNSKYTGIKDCYFIVNDKLPSRAGCIGKFISADWWEITLMFPNDLIKTMDQSRLNPLPLGVTVELKWHFNRVIKPIIPPRKNKFDQELEKGVLVVGSVGRRNDQNCLMFGHVTRWTEQTVWINPYGNFADAKWMRASVTKVNDVKLIDYKECFLIEETDDLKSQLLIQILRC